MSFFPSTIVEGLTFIDGVPPGQSSSLTNSGNALQFCRKSTAMATEVMAIACIAGAENSGTLTVSFEECSTSGGSYAEISGKTYTLTDSMRGDVLIMSLKASELTEQDYYFKMKIVVATGDQHYQAALFGGNALYNPHSGWKFSPTEDLTASATQLVAQLADSIK